MPQGDTPLTKLLKSQDRRRVGFIIVVILFVYAQSFAGRVYLHRQLLEDCQRAQIAFHYIREPMPRRVFVNCARATPQPSPWPWH